LGNGESKRPKFYSAANLIEKGCYDSNNSDGMTQGTQEGGCFQITLGLETSVATLDQILAKKRSQGLI
jgi:hypothetical protein